MTMDIMAGIAAASQALKMAREIREVSKDYENADLKSKIVTLVDSLSDAKLALVDAKENLQSAKAEADDLRAKLAFKSTNTIRRNGMLYEVLEPGKVAAMPFCPKCSETGHFVTVRHEQNWHQSRCPNCSAPFATRSISFRDEEFLSLPPGVTPTPPPAADTL